MFNMKNSVSGHPLEYALFFFYRMVLFPLSAFLPLFLETKNITGGPVGLLIGEIYIIGILVTIPSGMLNDRIESRKMITASLFIFSAGIFLLVFGTSFWVFVLIFALIGLGRNLFQVSFDALFFKQIIKGKKGEQVGFYQLILAIAILCGLLLSSIVLKLFSLKVFLVGCSSLIFIAFLFSFKLKVNEIRAVSLNEYKLDILNWKLIVTVILIFLFALHWGAEDTCYSLFLSHYLKLTPTQSSLYMSCEFVTFGLAAYVSGKIVDNYNFNLRRVFAVGILVSGLTLILKVNPVVPISLAMRMVHGAADGLVFVVIYYGISRVFALDKVGGSVGIINFALVVGAFTGAIVFSRIGKTSGYHYSFIVSGSIMIIVAIAFLIMSFILNSRLNPDKK